MSQRPQLTKTYIGFLVLFFLCYLGLKIWNGRTEEIEISLAGNPAQVYLANTPAQLYKGLSDRSDLAGKDGMFFIFPGLGRHGIVMRDMRFPLDIVWLQNNTIVDMVKQAPLEPGVAHEDLKVYYPSKDANFVVELEAGWLDKHGIVIGDELRIKD